MLCVGWRDCINTVFVKICWYLHFFATLMFGFSELFCRDAFNLIREKFLWYSFKYLTRDKMQKKKLKILVSCAKPIRIRLTTYSQKGLPLLWNDIWLNLWGRCLSKSCHRGFYFRIYHVANYSFVREMLQWWPKNTKIHNWPEVGN